MRADAFVLAAGFGTRMRPLTEVLPKPLVPVCGVPLLSWSLALCAQHGLKRVVVNAHWLHETLLPWSGEHEGVQVALSVEQPEILGTGGGLKKVAGQLADRFAVLNADVLHAVDLTALLAAVPDGGGAMALRPSSEAERYGVVAADATGTVVRLTSLAAGPAEGEVAEDTHFTGIHALDRAVLDRVPDGFACIVRNAYVDLVPERRVTGIRYTGPWLDCGDPPAYLDTNLRVLRGEVGGAVDPFERAGFAVDAQGRTHGDPELVRGAVIVGPVWVGRGARIGAGARLSHAVIGAGARVADDRSIAESVVWDGIDVDDDLDRGIAWDTGAVVRA